MSSANWFLIGGIAILLPVIGGLLWFRHKSKQEETSHRSWSPVGRTLSAEEVRYPFGQPSAPTNSLRQPGQASVNHIRQQSVVAVPAVETSDTLDIDLDVAEATVASARIIGVVVAEAVARSTSDEEAGEPSFCQRPVAMAVESAGDDDQSSPQGSGQVCAVADDDNDTERTDTPD